MGGGYGHHFRARIQPIPSLDLLLLSASMVALEAGVEAGGATKEKDPGDLSPEDQL